MFPRDLPVVCRRPENRASHIQEGFVVDVAKFLNEKGIPCILTSETAVGIHGKGDGVYSVDFVIRDDYDYHMAGVLLRHPDQVQDVMSDQWIEGPPGGRGARRRSHPKPAFHLIFPGLGRDGRVGANIWKQSQVWWLMPPIPREFANPREAVLDPEDYIFADDDTAIRPTFSTNPFAKGYHPVILPTAARLFEASLALEARNAYDVLVIECRGAANANKLGLLFEEGIQDLSKVRSPFREYEETLQADLDMTGPQRTRMRDLRRHLGEPVHEEDLKAPEKDAETLRKRRETLAQNASG